MLWACTKEAHTPPPPAADAWPQEKLLPLLEGQRWRVESVLRKSSTGIVDLATDSTFEYKQWIPFRKTLIFWFRQGYVVFYSGNKVLNTQFADSVETVSAMTKIDYPGSAIYAWDEAQKTVIFSTGGGSGYLPIPFGKSAVVDKASIRVYNTIQEAQAAKVHENLTLLAEDTDPVLGKVTYVFKLKPAWEYDYAPETKIAFYAIF
jgi:hypothetical protein